MLLVLCVVCSFAGRPFIMYLYLTKDMRVGTAFRRIRIAALCLPFHEHVLSKRDFCFRAGRFAITLW
jgi:hypothetical protein